MGPPLPSSWDPSPPLNRGSYNRLLLPDPTLFGATLCSWIGGGHGTSRSDVPPRERLAGSLLPASGGAGQGCLGGPLWPHARASPKGHLRSGAPHPSAWPRLPPRCLQAEALPTHPSFLSLLLSPASDPRCGQKVLPGPSRGVTPCKSLATSTSSRHLFPVGLELAQSSSGLPAQDASGGCVSTGRSRREDTRVATT